MGRVGINVGRVGWGGLALIWGRVGINMGASWLGRVGSWENQLALCSVDSNEK